MICVCFKLCWNLKYQSSRSSFSIYFSFKFNPTILATIFKVNSDNWCQTLPKDSFPPKKCSVILLLIGIALFWSSVHGHILFPRLLCQDIKLDTEVDRWDCIFHCSYIQPSKNINQYLMQHVIMEFYAKQSHMKYIDSSKFMWFQKSQKISLNSHPLLHLNWIPFCLSWLLLPK